MMKKKLSENLLLYNIFDLNYLSFYEFFDFFGQVNACDCNTCDL